MKYLIFTILTFVVIWGASLAFMEGLERHERVICLKLRHQAEVYPTHLFYITQSEDNLCNRIGLPVVANVVE